MKLTPTRFLFRALGLVLVTAVGAFLLAGPLRAERLEKRIRTLLLEVQEGLQRYHVAEELYPKRPMEGGELVKLLVDGKHLETLPANPWTGGSYGSGGEDWLRYRTDGAAETYELTVVAPDGETVLFRLDSTRNQSLE